MFSAVVWQQMRAYTLALFTKLSGGKALEDKDIVDWANTKVIFAHRFLYFEQSSVVWLFVSRGVFRFVAIATALDNVASVSVGFRRKARLRKAILDVLTARKVGRAQKMRERRGGKEVSAIWHKDCECTVRLNIDANWLKWWNSLFFNGHWFWARDNSGKKRKKKKRARLGRQATVRGRRTRGFFPPFCLAEIRDYSQSKFFNIHSYVARH